MGTRIPWLILAAISLLLPTSLFAAEKEFQFGINGHPYTQEGYWQVPVEKQLDLVKELGVTWYRSDWNEAGFNANTAAYDKLVSLAAERNIRLLPVLVPTKSAHSKASLEEIKAGAFNFARLVATRYQGKITHWELDNELDSFAMLRKGDTNRAGVVWKWDGDPSGEGVTDYEESRYQRVKAELAALHRGIKSVNTNALTVVDSSGWLHLGFFERLVKEDKVPFDILGWHWYSEMGDMTKVQGKLNILELLKGHQKPIWITEINQRNGSMGAKEKEQAEYLMNTYRQMKSYPGVEAFFIYELLDQPYFGPGNGESHYGLVELEHGKDGKWQTGKLKPGFKAVQELKK